MQCVPWRPHALSFQIAVYQLFGECTQVSRAAQCILDFRQTCHKAVAFGFEYLMAGGGIH